MQLHFPDRPRDLLAPDAAPYAFTAAGDLYPVRIALARVHGCLLWVRTHAGLVVPHQWAWCAESGFFFPYGWRVPVGDPFLCLVSVSGVPRD